jgi:flagellar assembly factor FliW
VNCIKIRSKYLDEIEIESDQVIVFPEGLPAFEDERQFVIIPFAEDSPFFYLQSLRNARLCFILADIFTFFPDYQVEIDNHELQRLKIEEGGHGSLNIFALLTIPKIFSETTANLLAPLVINFEKQVGIQYIPHVSHYHTKHPLFEETAVSPARGVK